MRLNHNKAGSRLHTELATLDSRAGVYAIYKDLQVYIGSTKDLRSRLRAHTRRFCGWEFIYREFDITEARRRESIWIQRFKEKGFEIINHKLLQSIGRHPTVSRSCFHNRIKMGWSPERARTTPKKGT